MKTLLLLNVGLAVSGQALHLSPVTVLSLLAEAGFRVLSHRVAQSTTEPTLVALVLPPEDWHDSLYVLSCSTRQDCIAVQYPDGSGLLVGPGSRIWGVFNPDFFLPL
jgi:hypothetical protein